MNDQTPGPAGGNSHDRLNGWKDIAAHFGKSVRTVQRWERELGMPVHRLHTAGGEIIFARRSELEQWENNIDRSENNGLAGERARDTKEVDEITHVEETPGELMRGNAQAPAPQISPREVTQPSSVPAVPRRHRWTTIAAMIVLAAVFWAAWEHDRILNAVPALQKIVLSRAHRQPAQAVVAGNTVKVFNQSGEQLWEHSFPFTFSDRYAKPGSISELQSAKLDDLDHDGQKELLLVTWSDPRYARRLLCLNADGSTRFDLQPDRSVRFGGKTQDPPFLLQGFVLTDEPDGSKTIWASAVHNYEFASVLSKLDARGNSKGEYWSNGHIKIVQEGRYEGRRVMFVGAMDNEGVVTSFAALDYDHPSGFAPAENPKYRCDDCPQGTPLKFLVFPRTEMSRGFETRPFVSQVRPRPEGGATITVLQTEQTLNGHGVLQGADVWYTLDEHLQLIEAETGGTYRELHSDPFLMPSLKHAYRPKCEEQIFPVRAWDGKKFIDLPRPSKANSASVLSATLARR